MKPVTIQGKKLTTTKAVNNILKVYDASDKSGLNWYEEAHNFARDLAGTYLIDLETVNFDWELSPQINKAAGIIAALSPRKRWERNKKIAEDFLRDGQCGHIKLFVSKAEAILNSSGELEEVSDILSGNKIVSFFLNIVDPWGSSVVTIDRHAIRIALGEVIPEVGISRNQYEFLCNAYRIAAEKRDVNPLQIQSSTWVEWRDNK